MTPYQARKLVKSIAYRRQLLEVLPEMEAELIGYVQSNGSKYIAGYEVEVYDGSLRLRKLDPLEYRQLRLQFGRQHLSE